MQLLESAESDLQRLLAHGVGRRRFGSVIARQGARHLPSMVGEVEVRIEGGEAIVDIDEPHTRSPIRLPVELRTLRGVTWDDPTLRLDLGPGRVILVTWA